MDNRAVELRHERFEALYDDYRLPVLGYCMRRLHNDDAGDACSETFLVAWRRLDKMPDPPETLPYLYGIASKVVSNQTRSTRRRTRLDAKLRHLGVAPAADPSTLVVRNTQHQEVIDALNRLRPRDREIVMLYTWEDLSREIIARMMGMTKAAVDQRIHRAYKKMAKVIETKAKPSRLQILDFGEERGG